MAVDFSILQSAATVPMRTQFTPVDVAGKLEGAYSLAGTMVDTQEKMRKQQSAQTDRNAVQNYLRSGGDLFTPPGIERAMSELRGIVSPEYFTRLGEQAQKLKTADFDLQKKVAGLKEDELAAYGAGVESAMPFLDALQRQYEADLQAGGAESALAKFNDNRAQLLTRMQGRMAGPNTPMFNAQVLQGLQAVTPEVLPGMISASKYQTTQIKNAMDAARAKAAATGKTENLVAPDGKVVANVPGVGLVDTATGNAYTGNPAELKPIVTGRGAAAPTTGRDWEQYTDPAGNIYESSRTLRQTVQVNKDGTRTEVPSLPADAFRVGSVAAARALVKPGDVPDLTPDENAKLAEFSRVYGRQIPVPSFGTGGAARQDRVLFLRNFVADMASRGETPTAAGVQASMARAGQEALKRITTQDVILSAGERELIGILDKMEAELKKIGGPDSPLVRRYWNRAATEIAGDPTFAGMNALYTAFIDEAARVTSGATGAAGTPVAYKQLAERMLDPNVNLSQLMAFKQPFKDMIEARQRGVEGAKNQLITSISPPPKRGEAAVPPGTQAGRDQERTTILRREYDAAVQRMGAATDPEARRRVMEDARSTREELRRLGVTVPLPGEPTAAPAPAAPSTDAIQTALRKAGRTYEPDKFDYRIGPDGSVQQRRKAQ